MIDGWRAGHLVASAHAYQAGCDRELPDLLGQLAVPVAAGNPAGIARVMVE